MLLFTNTDFVLNLWGNISPPTTMGKVTDIMCVCAFLTIDQSSSFLCSIGQLPFAHFFQRAHLNCIDLFLHLWIYLFNCMCMHTCHGVHVEIRGQLLKIWFFLLPRGYKRLNSGHHACWQAPLLVDPSHQSWFVYFYSCSSPSASIVSTIILSPLCWQHSGLD